MWRQILFFLLHGWFATAIAAEAQTLPGTDLNSVDVSTYPWSSIVKLNNSVGGSCTGVVIEQDKVLTAAHCIFNRRTGRFLPPSSLHVLLGYERGRFAFHALADSYAIGSGYEAQQKIATVSSDWAIVTLTGPLPDSIRPLQLVDRVPAAGARLIMGSYARRRLHVMTADKNCELLGEIPGSFLLAHTCQGAQGSSGAPLLLMDDESAVIIGIQVATGHRNGTDVMLAVSASSIAERQLH